MTFLRRLIHRLLGPTRYHEQANEVQVRAMRVHVLERRLQVITRSNHEH